MLRQSRELSPSDWFEAARRHYLEGHQGCACCGAQHCVFRSQWGPRVEYHCTACDFSVSHDNQSGRSFAAAGEPDFSPDWHIPDPV
jgi:hypothetical protein